MRIVVRVALLTLLAVIVAAPFASSVPTPCSIPAPPYAFFTTLTPATGSYVNPLNLWYPWPSPNPITIGGGASAGYCATTGVTAVITKIEVYRQIMPNPYAIIKSANYNSAYSNYISATDSFIGATTDARVNYQIKAYDNYGQVTTVTGHHLFRDATSPTITFSLPANVSGTYTFTPIITDGTWHPASVGVVFYQIDGVDFGMASVTPWSLTVDTRNFANGAHQITASVQDKSGRSSTVNLPFIVSNPSSTILAPPSGVTVSSATLSLAQASLSWTAPSGTVRHYTIYRDGIFIGKTQLTNFIDFAPHAGKTHSYQVSTTNTLGQEGLKSAGVTANIPTTAPTSFTRLTTLIDYISLKTLPATGSLHNLVYTVQTSSPATCTASTVTGNAVPGLMPAPMTRLSAPGVFQSNFVFPSGPGYYAVKPVCSPSCGNAVCENLATGGDETQANCPQDCGCPAPQVWDGSSGTCIYPCSVVQDTSYGSGYYVKGCASGTPSKGYLFTFEFCPAPQTCWHCAPGYYSQSTSMTCDRFVAYDGVCAWDIGEYDAWLAGTQDPGHECASPWQCPLGYGPPGSDCPVGFSGLYDCGPAMLRCLNGCPLQDPLSLSCA